MQQALYRKYRPQFFSDLVDQEAIKATLQNQVRQGKVAHAYLFAGPKGTGKTTMARILARAVNCLDIKDGEPCGKCDICVAADKGAFLDLIEIDAASNRGIDNIRELISKISLSPTQGKYKVYVIDEAHMLSREAFPALLKTLEEPPAHAIFILATTEADKIPPTIVSRCQRFDFRPIKIVDVKNYLTEVAKQESIQIEDAAVSFLAEKSGGGMRDALSLLERSAMLDTKVTVQILSDWLGFVDTATIISFMNLVASGEVKSAINSVEEIYRNGYDLNRFVSSCLEMARQLVMVKLNNVEQLDLTPETQEKVLQLAAKFEIGNLIWLTENLLTVSRDVKFATLPQLPIEVLVIKAADKFGKISHSEISKTPEAPVETKAEEVAVVEAVSEPVIAEVVVKEEAPVKMEDSGEFAWQKVLDCIRATSPTLAGMLSSCIWTLEGGKLVLEFGSNFHKEKMQQSSSVDLIRLACSDQGYEVEVECRISLDQQKAREGVDPGLISEVFG